MKNIAGFLYEVGTLRKIVRAHRQTLMTDDMSDNIASHSFRVSIIGWILAQKENVNTEKVLTMCLFHDVPESRSGDQNWVHKKYVKVFEEEIIKNQLSNLPDKEKLLSIINEYQERKTKEAKIAKDADLIDQILLLKEYEWQGNKEATEWLSGKGKTQNKQYQMLQSKSGIELARKIMKENPTDWWKNVWTEKRR